MHRITVPGRSAWCLALFLMAGCASSNLPREIRDPPQNAPAFATVRTNPDAYANSRVRWGGEIVALENRDGMTWIEILSRPLDIDGRPEDTDQTSGRFITRVEGFLDPAVYSLGRNVTVLGVVEQGVEGKIGNQPYLFPIVQAEMTYLWSRTR